MRQEALTVNALELDRRIHNRAVDGWKLVALAPKHLKPWHTGGFEVEYYIAIFETEREQKFVCNRCGAEKGEHALDESCQNNCGGKVVQVS